MEYATELQPVVAENIHPIRTFTVTFSEEKVHTDVSAHVPGTDIRCKISATYRDGDSKYLEEFEQEFLVLEQEMLFGAEGFVADGGRRYAATNEVAPTKQWTDFFRDACPDEREWAKAPVRPAPKLRDLCARVLLQPTHVEVWCDGAKKRLLWLRGAIAAQATDAVEKAAA